MKLYNSETTSTPAESKPRDCFACRAVGGAGLIGIGGYLGINASKNRSFAQKYFLSTLSFAFIVLGVARYKQTFPFHRSQEFEKSK